MPWTGMGHLAQQEWVTLPGDSLVTLDSVLSDAAQEAPAEQTTAAVPKLIEATLEAQSADIDAVPGAAITSDGYRESLQAALGRRSA